MPSGLQLGLFGGAAALTALGSLACGAAIGAGVWGVDGLRTQARLLLDDRAPRLTVASPGQAGATRTPRQSVAVRGRVDDASPVTVTVGGREATLTEVDGRRVFRHVVSLKQGANTIEVVATDAGGRRSAERREVERIPWTLGALQPRPGAVLREPWVEVQGSVSPPQAGEVRAAGAVRPIHPDGRFRFSLRGLREGPNELTVEVRPEGCASQTERRVVVVDSIAPVITLTAPTAGLKTFRAQVELKGQVADAGLTELTVGERSLPAEPGAFAVTVPLPRVGKHTLRVTARDRAGHETIATRVVERVRPRIDLQVDQPRDGAWLRATAIRVHGRVSGQVPLEELRLTVGGVEATVGEDGRFTAVLNRGEGVQRLEIVARGAGGEARSVRTITCDVTPPRVAVHTPHDYQTTTATSLPVRGTIEDAAPYVDVRAGFKSVRIRNPGRGRPFSLELPLKSGRNRLVVTAIDAAGNRAAPVVLNVVRRAPFQPTPTPTTGKVRLERLPIGAGARYGDWSVWRTTADLLLWVHAGAGYAVEVATDSNGWFRYADKAGKSWVVLGLGPAPRPQPLGSRDWKRYLTRKAPLELDTGAARLQRYEVKASAQEVRLENTQLQQTLVFRPQRSTYDYTHPSGKSQTFGPAGPVVAAAPPNGKIALAQLPVGSGARWGDWAVWRPRRNKLLLVHTAERHAVELILDSNGWFRMAPKTSRPIVVYTFGKNTPGNLGIVGWRDYLGRAPTYTLKPQQGSFYRYAFTLSDAALELRNTHFNDTLRFAASSADFTFAKPNRKVRRFGPGGEETGDPPPPPPPVGGATTLAKLPVGQGARFGEWTVWRLSRGRLLLTHAKDQAAVELVAASNGWFRFATKTGKQFIVHGYAGQPMPQRLSTRDYASYYPRAARSSLRPSLTVLDNWSVEVSTTELKLKNRKFQDTLILTRTSSRYRFTKPGRRDRWFSPKGELREQ